VGGYELRPGYMLAISRQGEQLYLAASGQPPLELQPFSETSFFAQALNSEIVFTKNDQDQVTGLDLKQEGQQIQARKIL
jgi:hypothetical protein